MSFGRQNNLVRRQNRADESFHRDRRRKKLDRAVMLEAGSRRRREPLLARVVGALVAMVSRRKR